uniref:Uncharacterized protein n=1 Tax=Romanomermis culicivorax TaxID=13658 RepID=A0A915JKN4_ROMCU
MAQDYGLANIVLSVKRNILVLKCENQTNPGSFWLYKKNKSKQLANGSESTYHECLNCLKLGAEKGRVTVRDNRIVSDPEVGHNILCVPSDHVDVESLLVKRQMLKTAENGEAPLRAYRAGLAAIPSQFEDRNLRDQIALSVPANDSIRSSLYW